MTDLYLTTTYFLDHETKDFRDWVQQEIRGLPGARARAIHLYERVRDKWRYDPYDMDFRPAHLRASYIFTQQDGHCVDKAVLLAAAYRAADLPARLRFYRVSNHLSTQRLEEILGSNELVFHGATEVWLDERWLTVTPAFNRQLCERLSVPTLDFDGYHDAIFQAFAGNEQFMEYLHDYGSFHDLPYELMIREFHQHYHAVFAEAGERDLSPLRISGRKHYLREVSAKRNA